MPDQSQQDPSNIVISEGDHVVVVIGGFRVMVEAGASSDGVPYVEIGGETCNLEGDTPGLYFLTPLSA